MSDYTVETIELTDTARIVVEYDQGTENPRTWAEPLTGALTVDGQRNRIATEPIHSFPGDLESANNRLVSWRATKGMHRGSHGSAPRLIDGRDKWPRSDSAYAVSDDALVTRWARIFHSITLDYADGTFWWADPSEMAANWPELVQGTPEYVEREKLVIKGDQAEYWAWAEGEVYDVCLQRSEGYAKISNIDAEWIDALGSNDPDLVVWELVEALGGNYLTREYTAQQVAGEHFDLTPAERAALGLTEKEIAA